MKIIKKLVEEVKSRWLLYQMSGCGTPKCSCYRTMIGHRMWHIDIERKVNFGFVRAMGWWRIYLGWFVINLSKTEDQTRDTFFKRDKSLKYFRSDRRKSRLHGVADASSFPKRQG